ncbi:MAG: ABC transporter substrate-binding protein [Gammaproteobacteria bacterium]|nr:ABC transporter substrate-binding protein [Gammaproteobacteria bacterium]
MKESTSLVLEALGKVSSNVPFIMPASIAETPGTEQIKSYIGSGPFIFKADEYKPGALAVYLKNPKYKARSEKPSSLAGGRPVHFDRVEWVIIRDPQTQFNALVAGEVDMIEQPEFAQVDALRKTKGMYVENFSSAGGVFVMRFNFLHPPFNHPKIRQAAMVAMGQKAYLDTQVGIPDLVRTCRSIYPCGNPYADENTGYFTGVANPAKAKDMLKEAGYDGTPIVLMRPTDVPVVSKLPLVAKQQLEAAGFVVDLQQMDLAAFLARRAKKDAPAQGGWHLFLTAWTAGDISNPVSMAMLNAKGLDGWFGWQDEPRIEFLKLKFARSQTQADKIAVAKELQQVAIETATHAPLGQFFSLAAMRDNVTGRLQTPGVPVFWNVSKK